MKPTYNTNPNNYQIKVDSDGYHVEALMTAPDQPPTPFARLGTYTNLKDANEHLLEVANKGLRLNLDGKLLQGPNADRIQQCDPKFRTYGKNDDFVALWIDHNQEYEVYKASFKSDYVVICRTSNSIKANSYLD